MEPETLPAREEIADDVCPDGRYAIKTFFGKTLEEAELHFTPWNSLGCIESLSWMKPIGFQFYVHAAVGYILSQRANGDSDVVSSMCNELTRRLESTPQELVSIAGTLAEFCERVATEFVRFDADPEIYGNLQDRYANLSTELARLIWSRN